MNRDERKNTKSLRLARPAQNRSLERGIDILRAFRPGADLLGNSDIAERTGLAPATVSRLTQTLVRAGMLNYYKDERAYRLAAPLLSLAHAMRSSSPILQTAAPLMRKLAEDMQINVGLATIDHDEMVYLESVRYNKKVSLRSVVAGQRVPVERTSLGRAYLASIPQDERDALLHRLKERRPSGWPALHEEIDQAIHSVRQTGYCIASWQPEVIALATPLIFKRHAIHVLNVSVATKVSMQSVVERLGPALLGLADLLQTNMALNGHE